MSSRLARQRRAATPGADTPEGLPTRRQWGRLAIGLSIALLGGWLFAALYLSAGSRVSVVVLARDVQAFQPLTEEDLATERVAAGDRVDTISGDEIDDLVGHHMRVTLTEGTILSRTHLAEDENELIPAGTRIVGMELSRSEAPQELRAGDPVQVVLSGDADEGETVDEDEDEICGGVTFVGPMDQRTGRRKIDVIVPAEFTASIGAASAEGDAAVARRSSVYDTNSCDETATGWDGSSASDDGGTVDDSGTTDGGGADDGGTDDGGTGDGG